MSTYTLAQLVEGSWRGGISDVDTPLDNPPDCSDCPFDPPEPARESWQLDDEELLALAAFTRQQADAARGQWLAVLADLDRQHTTQHALGMSTDSWLAAGTTHSARTARVEVRLAGALASLPVVARGLATGTVSIEQADVICHSLARTEGLELLRRHQVAAHLVEWAAEVRAHPAAPSGEPCHP